MNIHESAEDYLEAILRLKEAKGYARSVDISLLLGVTKPSVSVAMKRLRENGYLTMDADNLITLTPAGMEIARSIYDRHKTLSSFLESLGVDSDVARSGILRGYRGYRCAIRRQAILSDIPLVPILPSLSGGGARK